MKLLLPSLIFTLAGATAVPAAAANGHTADCTISAEGNASLDCEMALLGHIEALATQAGMSGQVSYGHHPKHPGVYVTCDPTSGAWREYPDELSPVMSVTCGTSKRISTGHKVFSIARACQVEAMDASVDDSLAAIAAHEIAHLVHDHSVKRQKEMQKVCGAWSARFKTEHEYEIMIKGLTKSFEKRFDTKAKRQTPEAQAEFASMRTAALEQECLKQKPALVKFVHDLEREADADGQALMKGYLGKRGEAAYICMLKGVRDFDWLIAPEGEDGAVSLHPNASGRVAAAQRSYGMRLKAQAKEFCAEFPDSPMCKFTDIGK